MFDRETGTGSSKGAGDVGRDERAGRWNRGGRKRKESVENETDAQGGSEDEDCCTRSCMRDRATSGDEGETRVKPRCAGRRDRMYE